MTVGEALAVAIQIASALDRAHRQGIVHRDLKPGNVMLSKGVVKLLDFGLARLSPAGAASGGEDGLGRGLVSLADLSMPTVSSPLTMKGTILGTLQYMSPEQLEGKNVDACADIFAFGGVLFEMLTGRRPFEGKSQASLIGSILDHHPPPVTSLQPASPPMLDEIVGRCLAKDPEDRWQSARDLKRQLEWLVKQPLSSAALDGSAVHAQTAARPDLGARALDAGVALVAGVLIAGSAVAWMLWPQAAEPPAVSRFTIQLPEGQAFTRSGRRVLAMSPDGSHLVYVANRQLYLRDLRELTAVPISGTAEEDPAEPVFSPDGQWVAYWSENELRKVPIAGGTPLTLGAAENPYGASWTGDRILLGQENPRGIIEVPANGGPTKTLVLVDEKKDEWVQSPQLVSRGRSVLFTLRTGSGAWHDSSIVVQNLATGRRRVLVEGGTDARALSTGHLVYSRDATLFAMPFDEDRLAVTGSAVPVQPGIKQATAGFTGAAQVAWSGSGSLALIPDDIAGASLAFLWMNRQGREERATIPARLYWSGGAGFRVSPDGTHVAVRITDASRSGSVGSGSDIWVWEIARDTLTRLSFTGAASDPVWSADGQRVCYESRDEVFCQAADGRGQAQAMFKVDQLVSIRSVSPDGLRMLLWTQTPQSRADITVATVRPPPQIRSLIQTPSNEEAPTISPDGRWIAYASDESGRAEVYVRPFPAVDQGRWQISTGGGDEPRWASSGRELYFVSSASAGASISLTLMSVPVLAGSGFVTGTPTPVMKVPVGAGFGFDVAPDGRFLFNVPASSADRGERLIVVQHWFEELKARVPTTSRPD